jgi:hypothetical protein
MFRTHRLAVVAVIAMLALVAWAQTPDLGIGGRPKPITIPACTVVQPDAVTGGQTAQCTVTLNAVVEESDDVVEMETDHPEVFANFPDSVVVPVGYDSVTFPLQTVTVSGSVQATVTAYRNGGQASGTLTVNP